MLNLRLLTLQEMIPRRQAFLRYYTAFAFPAPKPSEGLHYRLELIGKSLKYCPFIWDAESQLNLRFGRLKSK